MKLVSTTNTSVNEDSRNEEMNSLVFEDVVIYNEMAETTSVRLNLLEQIKNQMNQLEEISERRQFVMKEIMTYFSK